MTADHEYWTAVTVLGRLDADPAAVTDVLGRVERNELDPAQLFSDLKDAKVARLALAKLDSTAGPVYELLSADDSYERRRYQSIAEPTRRVLWHASGLGIRVIKGLAVRSVYPVPAMRYTGDIDLQTSDWLAAVRLVRQLLDDGWSWDTLEPPWLKWDEFGVRYGQIAMSLATDVDLAARVDLHIGAFSVGHMSRMPLTGWRPLRFADFVVQVPDTDNAVALVATHAFGDTRLSMKDVNDLYALLTWDSTPDWSSVVELCRAAGALEVLGQLLDQLVTVYGVPGLPRVPGRPVLRPRGLRGAARGQHFAEHARRIWLAEGGGAEDAGRLAAEAYRYFTTDLRPRLCNGMPMLPTAANRHRNLCWRLLPESTWRTLEAPGESHRRPPATVEEELADGLVLVVGGAGAAVVLAGSVLVPTVWGDVHPDALAIARSLDGVLA